MNKKEYIQKLDKLNLDKTRYCIISGGVMLLYDLKESTEDIDIKIRPDYFEELKKVFTFKKSPKYPYLYELDDSTEVAVLDYSDDDIRIVDGYPVESLELQLKWMMEQNRPKDQEKIKIIKNFLENDLERRLFMKVNPKVKKYIEENVFPEYEKNESGHGIDHIKSVINRSFELVEENQLNVNLDMVYVIAAYHDIGHHIDSKTHEIISADIMSKDKNLTEFFNEEELKTIKEAIEDHRASSKEEPRSIYGRIVSSADRNNNIEDCLRRTYTYGKKLNPDATDEELYLRAYDVLLNKFGENGYAKFYFKDSQYEEFLKELRTLLKDKEKYLNTQREYIKQLKRDNKI